MPDKIQLFGESKQNKQQQNKQQQKNIFRLNG